MLQLVPTRAFFTKGVGIHKDYLASFEDALRDAGIAALNVVTISSIMPPGCKIVPKKAGLKELHDGQVAFCVMSRQATNEYRRMIAASVGVSIPKDPTKFGYLSEYHTYGVNDQQAGDYAEDLAASMLATTMGLPFDPSKAWNERKQEWKLGGEIVTTRNVTQSAEGPKDMWATVIAACVFIFDNWQVTPDQLKALNAGHQGLRVPELANPKPKRAKKKK
ncbi:MAG: arginine decarboxylase, pyruvoyl-dependent [Planctomycetes bacterium]|nr:arginine decarboxylase, pyruvoyl-dependent [Planctomycetota bacterium]